MSWSVLDPNQTPDAEGPMKRLAADDPLRLERAIFREIDDQVIDQVLNEGIGRVIVRERVKILGGVELQHGGFSPGIKKPARGGFDEGVWGFLKDRFGWP